jgi:hypothetical protein
MAKRRPSYLIVVAGKNGLEIFSAHNLAGDADLTFERLDALLRSTGEKVYLIEVPQKEGMVKGVKRPSSAELGDRIAEAKIVTGSPPNNSVNSVTVTIPATQEEFDEQTRQMLKGSGPRDGYRNDNYQGAFS